MKILITGGTNGIGKGVAKILANTGVGYESKRIETENRFDSHFQVNYLSQFMLTLNCVQTKKRIELQRIFLSINKKNK